MSKNKLNDYLKVRDLLSDLIMPDYSNGYRLRVLEQVAEYFLCKELERLEEDLEQEDSNV